MYEPGTILVRKEPQGTDEAPNAYDRVKVVGPSPFTHNGLSEWEGISRQGIIIQPAGMEYGANVDQPFGRLQELYDVAELPEPVEVDIHPKVRIINTGTASAGPSPEEVFSKAAT